MFKYGTYHFQLNEMITKVEYYLGTVRSAESRYTFVVIKFYFITVYGPVEYDPEYQLIVESNNMIVEIDNEICERICDVLTFTSFLLDTIHKYIKDLYSKRFPELESMVYTPVEYMKTVQVSTNHY